MIRRNYGIAALLLSGLLTSPAFASVIYDAGNLEFESTAQSMWGSGPGFRKAESVFVGKQWTNAAATIGGVAGGIETVIPALGAVTVPVFEPRIFVPTPSWSNPFSGYWTGCNCFKDVEIKPATDAVTVDTRTGAEVTLKTSGKVGLEFGYAIDGGTVDTVANFDATAELPDLVNAGEFFSINTADIFTDGAMQTQSPKAEAYISAIMNLSGSVEGRACALTFGCESSGVIPLDFLESNLDQRILSIDPGSLKLLDGILPSGEALAEIPIFNQSLTLEGGVSPLPPYLGFKLTNSFGGSLINTLPSPAVTADLAEISLNAPDIATSGSGGGTSVTSMGRDDLLSAQLDLDGAATLFAGLPPAGLNFDLIDIGVFKLGVSLDLIDVDAGPVLGITQDFEFKPTLMVNFAFSNPVQIPGFANPQSSWSGLWKNLPQFAIASNTTFSPTFWLDAMLTNDMGLDLGLVGTLDVLKLGATASVGPVDLLGFNPISLNNLLGLDNTLFETDKIGFSVYKDTFSLGGFNLIAGRSFTLGIGSGPVIGGDPNTGGDPTSVPEPGTLLLLLTGLLAMLAMPVSPGRRIKSLSA